MGKQSRKEKYNQWGLEDSLTLQEKRIKLRESLSKRLGRQIPTSASVHWMLTQLEKLKRTGYVN